MQWSCDVLGYFEETVYEHELEPEWHTCVDCDGLVDVNRSSLLAFADKILTST